MTGVITNRDILAHPYVTIHCFGWRFFFLAIFSGHENTCLSLLQSANVFSNASPSVTDLLTRSIALELRAKHIYESFAKTFESSNPAKKFFDALAQQEQDHADILQVCQTAAARGCWKMEYLNPWQAYIPRLEEKLQGAEEVVRSITSLDDALRLVVQLESSEVNQVFQAILSASDSVFVKKMSQFKKATETHISFIAGRLIELSPQMSQLAQDLRAKFMIES
jgi:rubrerythrin